MINLTAQAQYYIAKICAVLACKDITEHLSFTHTESLSFDYSQVSRTQVSTQPSLKFVLSLQARVTTLGSLKVHM